MPAAQFHDFYTRPGRFTSPGAHLDALLALPSSIPELFAAVQGLVVHEYLPWLYGIDREPGYTDTAHLRTVEDILDRLLADGRALTEPRAPRERFGGCCRHFTILTVAALRAHGIPARARCGFAAYFSTPNFEDHWVVEYWSADQGRWLLGDPQIDSVQYAGLKSRLDFTDIPRDQFLVAGEAWKRCREGDDPNRYGFNGAGLYGESFIVGDLFRDTAALSNVEMLPWDFWSDMIRPGEPVGAELRDLLDRLADLTADPDTAADVRDLYEADERLRVPERVFNLVRDREEDLVSG